MIKENTSYETHVYGYCIRNDITDRLMRYLDHSGDEYHPYKVDLIELDEDYDIWYVKSPIVANWVLHNSTMYYNSGYASPTHRIEGPENYSIVKVRVQVCTTTTIHPKENIVMPTNEQILEKHKKTDPRFYEERMSDPKCNINNDRFKIAEYLGIEWE